MAKNPLPMEADAHAAFLQKKGRAHSLFPLFHPPPTSSFLTLVEFKQPTKVITSSFRPLFFYLGTFLARLFHLSDRSPRSPRHSAPQPMSQPMRILYSEESHATGDLFGEMESGATECMLLLSTPSSHKKKTLTEPMTVELGKLSFISFIVANLVCALRHMAPAHCHYLHKSTICKSHTAFFLGLFSRMKH